MKTAIFITILFSLCLAGYKTDSLWVTKYFNWKNENQYVVYNKANFDSAMNNLCTKGGSILVLDTVTLTVRDTICAKVTLDIAGNGYFKGSADTLVVLGTVGSVPGRQWIDTSITPEFASGSCSAIHSAWFGTSGLALQRAINSYKSVFIDGIITSTQQINLLDSTYLFGDISTSKIMTTDTTIDLLYAKQKSHIIIEGIELIGGGKDQTDPVDSGNCLWTDSCDNVILQNAKMSQFDDGWYATECSNILAKNNTFFNISGAHCRWTGVSYGIFSDNQCIGTRTIGDAQSAVNAIWLSQGTTTSNNCVVSGNNIYNTSYEAILVKARKNSITGNSIYKCLTGIDMASAAGESVQPVLGGSYNTATGNNIKNCVNMGIRIGIASGSNLVAGHHNIVTGNNIDSTGEYGIVLTNDASYNTIVGNRILNTGKDGIRLYYAAANNILSDNHIDSAGNGVDTFSCGIRIHEGANNVISGNVVSHSWRDGIYVYGQPSNLRILNNTCFDNSINDSSYSGIRIRNTAVSPHVFGNKCYNTDAAHFQEYGIWLDTTLTTPLVKNNWCFNNRTGQIRNVNKLFRITDNDSARNNINAEFYTASDSATDNVFYYKVLSGALGKYGPSIGFSGVGHTTRQAAIVTKQTGSDADWVGLSFFTHPSSTETDSMQEAVSITHDKKLLLYGLDKSTSTSTGALQVDGGVSADSASWFGDNVGIGVSPTARLHIAAGTATASTAPLKFTNGTLLGTPEVGTFEFSNEKPYFTCVGTQRVLDRTSDVKLTSDTVVNSDVETTVYTALIPANSLRIGNVLKLNVTGHVDETSAADLCTLKVKFGTTTMASIISPGTGTASQYWHIRGNATVRTIGGTGLMAWHLDMDVGGTSTDAGGVSVVDYTTAENVTVTATWNNAKAGNIFICDEGYMEYKN